MSTAYLLKSLENDDLFFPLDNDHRQIVLGRNNVGSKNDKRLSRKQARVEWMNGRVSITQLGVNTISVNDKSLTRNLPHALDADDTVYLLAGGEKNVTKAYPFILKMELDKVQTEEEEKEGEAAVENFSTNRQDLNKKKKTKGNDDVNDVDADPASTSASKKRRKPECQYGAGCYRKNPGHLEEFYHPPAQDAGAAELAVSSKKKAHREAEKEEETLLSKKKSHREIEKDEDDIDDEDDSADQAAAKKSKKSRSSSTASETPAAAPASSSNSVSASTSVSASATVLDKSAPTHFVFTAFSTAKQYGFPEDRLSKIIARAVQSFLAQNRDRQNLRLTLITRPQFPAPTSVDGENLDERFKVFTLEDSNFAALNDPVVDEDEYSQGVLAPFTKESSFTRRLLAIEVNWKMSPTGSLVRAQKRAWDLIDRVDQVLERQVALVEPPSVGQILSISVPPTERLARAPFSVKALLLCRGPTINGESPDATNEENAAKQLQDLYTNLFKKI